MKNRGVTNRVRAAIAYRKQCQPIELAPIGSVVDTEKLEQTLQTADKGEIPFTYYDYQVTVEHTGKDQIDDLPESASR